MVSLGRFLEPIARKTRQSAISRDKLERTYISLSVISWYTQKLKNETVCDEGSLIYESGHSEWSLSIIIRVIWILELFL